MLSLLFTLALFLQGTPGSPSGPPGLPNNGGPVQAVPVDGGLSLLAAAGGAYAVRRLRARR